MTKERKTADELFAEIATVVGGMEGIAMSDAFRLATLVKEYGSACASESMKPFFDAMLKQLDKKDADGKEPWKDGA